MKPNRRARQASRNHAKARLSFYLENAASRYAKRFGVGVWTRYLKARNKILRAYSSWLCTKQFPLTRPYFDWASKMAKHKRKNNPAYQKVYEDGERRSRENAKRREEEVKEAARQLLVETLL